MKYIKIYLVTTLITAYLTNFGQSPIITPAPGNYTVCPVQSTPYSVIPGPNFTNCTSFTWTVSNGHFNFAGSNITSVTTQSATTEVIVFWNDSPSTGTLTVSATGCSEGPFSKSSTYAIRSLAGRVPQNAIALQSLPYCSQNTIALSVDDMLLLNTGGTTGITQQYADGYEWTLPTGWSFSGASNSRIINIFPDNGCRGGTVTVKAYVNCSSGKKYSSPASVNINRPTPSITVTPPSGYTGPSCGAVQPVTFTVTPISCATSYTWVFNGPDANTPTGWLPTPGPVVTTTNYITVTPSGSGRDGGTIQVTANLYCGTQLMGSIYTLNYKQPAIVPASAICFGGTNVTLTNVAPSIAVNWSVSSNINIVSGQGTSNAVMKASTNSFRGTGTIDATVSCPNTTVPQKTTWVGVPNQITDILKGSGAIAIGATVPFSIQDPNNMNTGIVTYDWDVSGGYFAWIDTYAWTTITEPYLVLYAGSRNACGSLGMISRGWNVDTGGCPPGEICEMSVFPNPSSDELTVSLASADNNSTITDVKLRDSNGTVVYSGTAAKNAKDIKIPVKDLRNGTYYLSITQGRTIKQQQIIIRH